MKKIVAINCSPRSAWNTATLVREAAKGAENQGAEVELLDLYKLENKVAFEMMAARMATMAGLEAPGKGTIQKSIENNGFMSKPVAEWQPVGNNRHKLDLGRVLLEDLSDKVSEG